MIKSLIFSAFLTAAATGVAFGQVLEADESRVGGPPNPKGFVEIPLESEEFGGNAIVRIWGKNRFATLEKICPDASPPTDSILIKRYNDHLGICVGDTLVILDDIEAIQFRLQSEHEARHRLFYRLLELPEDELAAILSSADAELRSNWEAFLTTREALNVDEE